MNRETNNQPALQRVRSMSGEITQSTSASDNNPWVYNPCIDEQGHSVVWGDDDSSARLDRCVACGLTVEKDNDKSVTRGYRICGTVFDDVEAVKRRGEEIANSLIESVRPAVAEVCISNRVACLDLFGSMATGLAGPESDVDVLVRFIDDEYNLFGEYFDLKRDLEEIFERDVDIVVERDFGNPYFRRSIERSRRNIYAR